MDAIILCGGLGTRIRTVTNNSYPKAMIQIHGKTILQWELSWLKKHGVDHAILAVRHLAEYIEQNLGKQYDTGYGIIDISYSKEQEKLGSGGAVRLASQYITTEKTLVMNGDILTNYNLAEMIKEHNNSRALGTIAIAQMRSPYGIAIFDENNTITTFQEKPLLNKWIHAGVDIFNADVLPRFPEKGQMEDTIFVELANQRQLKAYQIANTYYWRSIDTPKDFQEADKEWQGI
ncbi:MAG: nucleotidyltransferase family protein [Candidatus Heimdallarchaeaceae archaeon]